LKIKIPVSAGEIIDKLTILEIKAGRVKDTGKLSFIFTELIELSAAAKKIYFLNNKNTKKLVLLKKSLSAVNKKLWDIENEIRIMESKNIFNNDFIKLARSVYINNDKRALLKQKINLLTGSVIKEVKDYKA
jgi:hypothetical protein